MVTYGLPINRDEGNSMHTELTKEEYAEQVEHLYEDVLKPRMVKALEVLADAFKEAGYETSGPHDLTADEFSWYLNVSGNGLPESVDLRIEIAESVGYEGTTEGVNIGLGIVAEGGRVLGGLAPYNFTSEVWAPLDNQYEIESRMEIIEQSDPSEAVALVEAFVAEDRS